jgi:excisionase family DNA binding protein
MAGPYVPIEEVAKHLGVSVSTIRKWIKETHIPRSAYIKVGNTYRFDVAAVIAALTPVDSAEENAPAVRPATVAVTTDALEAVLGDLDDDL